MKYFALLLGVMSVFSATTFAQVAHGATDPTDSMAVTPAMQKIDVKAGSATANTFTVINDGKTTYNFIVYGRPYSVKNEQYEAQFEKTSANTDLYQWVKFEKVAYTLAPGERVDISYDIHVPATATPGGHYGVIFAETQPDSAASNSVLRKKRIGSIVLANVEGKTITNGSLASSAAAFWQSSAPLTVSNRIENKGNTDFQATVATRVEDLFGSVKYSERNEYVIYPNTIRKVVFAWETGPWFGLFKVNQTVTVLDKSTNVSHLVLLAPRWLVLIMIVLIVIGAAYVLLRRTRR